VTIFEPFPKLARLSRECVITEKLDGTNAQIYIVPYTAETADAIPSGYTACINDIYDGSGHVIYVGSRTRIITPGKMTDNFGFAAWVYENQHELVKLGPGRHFGEWYGKGIQRGYGLDEKRFALFHTHGIAHKPDIVGVVPTIYTGEFSTPAVELAMMALESEGSHAVPGFMDPEGVVVFHEHAKVLFKKTFDDKHKEAA
jgi:hypothetical protein